MSEPTRNTYAERKQADIQGKMKVSQSDKYENTGLVSTKDIENALAENAINRDPLASSKTSNHNIAPSMVKKVVSDGKNNSKISTTKSPTRTVLTGIEIKSGKRISSLSAHNKAPTINESKVLGITREGLLKKRTKLEKKSEKYQKALNKEQIKYNNQVIRQLKAEKKKIGHENDSSKNVAGKSAAAIRSGVSAAKSVTNDLNEESSDNVLVERSIALGEKAISDSARASIGMVKAVASVASLEAMYKIKRTSERKNDVKEQIREIKGVNQTIKKRRATVYSTNGDKTETANKIKKDIKYNKEQRDSYKSARRKESSDSKKEKKQKKKDTAKENEKANRNAYIKKYTRQKIINFMIKPKDDYSDKDVKLSSGFGGFVSGIAKSLSGDLFKSFGLWLITTVGEALAVGFAMILNIIIMLMPIIIPVAAIVGTFSWMMSDTSDIAGNSLYCATVLNEKYDAFNKDTHDWTTKTSADGSLYKVNYVDGCNSINNFNDALILYIALSADDLSMSESYEPSDDDNAYLIVDTDAETTAMDTAFSLLNYAETDETTRNIYRKTLADIKGSLTSDQQDMLELAQSLLGDSGSSSLGTRTPGEYADDVGFGSGLASSEKGGAAVELAKTFIGNKYVWGGTDPYTGIDCSGFVQYLCGQFGVSLPRVANEQVTCGDTVPSLSEAQPGDLIFYSKDGTDSGVYHVTMYMGDGQMIHASNSAPYPKGGIKTNNVYGTPYKIKRVLY